MQYREPINVSEIVSELRRLWVVPVAVGLVVGLLFVVVGNRSGGSFEQRVDIVGTDVREIATSLQIPGVVETFQADVAAQREKSKLEVLNRQSDGSKTLRVEGSAQTNTLSIIASAPSPEAALDLAKTYAQQVVDAQRAAAADRLKATDQLYRGQLAQIQQSLDAQANGDESERVLLLVDRASTIRVLAGLSAFEQVAERGRPRPGGCR